MVLARWSMEVSVLVLIFTFIVALTFAQNRAKERREKLRIIEEAIRSGHLDPAMKQELVTGLSGRRPPPPGPPAIQPHGWLSRATFAIGWLGLFLGIGLIVIDDRDTVEPGIAILAVSFALVTLPIAMREFEREKGRGRPAERR